MLMEDSHAAAALSVWMPTPANAYVTKIDQNSSGVLMDFVTCIFLAGVGSAKPRVMVTQTSSFHPK